MGSLVRRLFKMKIWETTVDQIVHVLFWMNVQVSSKQGVRLSFYIKLLTAEFQTELFLGLIDLSLFAT